MIVVLQKRFRIILLILNFTIGILVFNACQNQISKTTGDQFSPTHTYELTPNPEHVDLQMINNSQQEYLLIWGREYWPDGDCNLWIIKPNSQEVNRNIIETPWCYFTISDINNTQQIVSFMPFNQRQSGDLQSSEIFTYEIDEDGLLQPKQTMTLEDLQLTSIPQWRYDNTIIFSAIKDNKEGIYTYDNEKETILADIHVENGFATAPRLSPNGDYIAYEIWEDHIEQEHNSRYDCNNLTCNVRRLHIWDIETNIDTDLKPFYEPFIVGESYYLPCNPEWAIEDNILAFELGGCGEQTPGSIILVDADQDEIFISSIINSVDDQRRVTKYQWIEGNRLMINGAARVFNTVDDRNGYLQYTADTNILEILSGLPERNNFDFDLVYFSDWTNDGEYSVGQTQVPGNVRTINIVIAQPDNEPEDAIYSHAPGEFVENPTWSPHDQNIAYRTYSWEDGDSESNFIVIDKLGRTIFDSGVLLVNSPEFQWYVQ